MKLRVINMAVFGVWATLLFPGVLPVPAAQAASKVYQVGIVLPDDEWASSIVGLKEGMKALGYE